MNNGKQLFEKYIEPRDEYSGVLMTAFNAIGEDLFAMLEKAESEGKKIVLLSPLPESEGPSEPYPAIEN